MDKSQQLIELFKNDFADFEKFLEVPAPASFKCSCSKECKVNLEKEAAYTGIIGDLNTDIMIIAESPSTKNGSGCYTGGQINHLLQGKDKNLKRLIQFLINYDKEKRKPYFTDTIKCGLERTREKEKLSPRKDNCTKRFLLKEIEIIQPSLIVCLGRHSYNILLRFKNEGYIKTDINIIMLHHYSNRASLTLTIEDKENIIWPIQLKTVPKSEAFKKALTIKHLEEMINKINNE